MQTRHGETSCDVVVWIAISYLDSATDYREYLPGRCPCPEVSELVMLEDSKSAGVSTRMAWLTLAVPVMLLVVALLFRRLS